MMFCFEFFFVFFIYIVKVDFINGYLNVFCEKEKVSELIIVVVDF